MFTLRYELNLLISRPCRGSGCCRRPLTTEVQVRSRASPCEICGGQRDSGEGFYSNTSLSSFSIIPKMLHAHLHVNTSFIRRTSGRNFGTLKQINAFSDIGECEIEEYEYLHIIL